MARSTPRRRKTPHHRPKTAAAIATDDLKRSPLDNPKVLDQRGEKSGPALCRFEKRKAQPIALPRPDERPPADLPRLPTTIPRSPPKHRRNQAIAPRIALKC